MRIWRNYHDGDKEYANDGLIAQGHEKNRKPCSCMMCCNRRRSGFSKGKEKLTRQERKSENSFKDQLDEL